jgi:hypothetical protein
VVIAPEGWTGSALAHAGPGELVPAGPDLSVDSVIAVPQPPARLVPRPAKNPNIDT